ncbi:MAG TPA: PP2C family protein-serine/threonine phosphatase [Edaphobacter sp.]|nr:PP2C family protein-serine/threonine phosphatase [Edaphobacter sp.]
MKSPMLGWVKRIPTGLAGATIWLALWFCALLVLHMLPGGLGSFFGVLEIFAGIALAVVAVALAIQIVRRRMLWSLRSKLVLTYLLIGLAPAVLFVTLVLISAYIAAGQFAIHLADSRLQSILSTMSMANGHRTELIARALDGQSSAEETEERDAAASADAAHMKLRPVLRAFIDGAPMALEPSLGKIPMGLPPWAAQLKNGTFHGLVLDGGSLYLVAEHQKRLADGRLLSLISSMAVDQDLMNSVADGLGQAMLFPAKVGSLTEERSVTRPVSRSTNEKIGKEIVGGLDPKAVNFADIRVRFPSTTAITDWDSGNSDSVLMEVDSRPSLLYQQLFGASIGGVVSRGIREGLIVLCVVFGLIELLALFMAIRLSRTITASVADLYEATREIDRGVLSHRIGVTRDDQLAELSRSFNKMTGSLQRLLEEQKEKERLQNEISIAQEVQANLFPQHISSLEKFELHGICRPARSVSGDYYDFLIFHEEANEGVPARRETGVGIAIGDISGKGISAALLMATLHSAVRAYRFASEELVYSESALQGLLANRNEHGDCDELFQSPGRILSLLNRHLFRSTQPEKYATLFLAHYEAASAKLTYSNAGQLPPLVLGRDGGVRRLDQGGTVVGLMDGMHYVEDSLQMQPGDILVAYSDGVTEPENDFGEFGEARLMEVVRRYRDYPLPVISSQVMQALDAWIGAEEQPDDITLVLARQA